MAIDYKKTGRAISACRQELKLSQQGLAGLMNVTHQAVSKWENGAALPDTPTLLALSKLFGVTMEALLMGEIQVGDENSAANRAMAQAAQNERGIQEMSQALQGEIEAQMREAFEAQAEEDVPEFEGFDVLEMDEDDEADGLPETIDETQFSRIVGMLPFVSTSMADQLFEKIAAQGTVAMAQLGKVAPFVSTRVLNDCVMKLIERGVTHEDARKGLTTLAPFLNQKTLERLIHGELGAIDAKLAQNLLPFVNQKTADALVKRMMEEPTLAQPVPKREMSEKCADIRWRIALKAMESGNIDWLEEHADELTDEQQEQLAHMAIERGDHDALEAVIADARPEVLNRLLEKAMAEENWELIELIEENM